jgi:hypothetical protein
MRSRTWCGPAFTALVAAAVFAAPAVADTADTAFLDALHRQGIPYLSEDYAIATAHVVCDYLEAGQPPDQVAVDTGAPSGWDPQHSAAFVAAATRAYCPR